MRHAGAHVSCGDCTRCGAPRGPALASPLLHESSKTAQANRAGIAAEGHALAAAAAPEPCGAQSAARSRQIEPSPAEIPDLGNIFEHYPCDEEGYAVAIDPSDADALHHAMDCYGVVVARVLPAAACAAGADEVFADCRVPRDGPPCAWENEHWPNPGRFLYGRPGAEWPTAKGPAAMRNRTHPMVHQTFKALFDGEHRLWVSADTYGIMRPTSCLAFPTPGGAMEIRDRPDWRWELKMHWDCNPWALQDEINNGRPTMFQGLIALVDCPEETGSFLAVPGCTRYFREGWAKQPQNNRSAIDLKDGVVNGKAYVPDKSILRSFAQRFSLRAGDLIVWDSRTAHANFANTGQNFRLVQFVQMMPAIDALEARHGHWARQLTKEADVEGMGLSPNARRLLALDDWGDEENC